MRPKIPNCHTGPIFFLKKNPVKFICTTERRLCDLPSFDTTHILVLAIIKQLIAHTHPEIE